MLQAAYLGLMKAIRGYDPSLGHAFSGYAMVTINGEVKRHFRDRTWAIRVPRVYQDRRAELNAVTGELTQDLGRSPTVAKLARRMNISEEDVLLTMDASAAYRTLSLDVPTGMDDDSTVLADLIAADDNSVDLVIDKHALRPLVRALPERERTILKLRFFDDRTQKEIADELGISQMHVSRILSKTFAHLRTELLAPC
ncbi:sigma-70 family RNA polymerase sigma factor [Nonomuraea sp. NPDC050310]|uniref:sigma-70 family RNA polymerase sigma factor n=1 Tax=Nonomuraea sp. NPDC050310 TaxID=3154935 RepID=UPI0033E70775